MIATTATPSRRPPERRVTRIGIKIAASIAIGLALLEVVLRLAPGVVDGR